MLAKLHAPGAADSVESWTINNASGDEYLIQIGFPRTWNHDPLPDQSAQSSGPSVPILYLTDGNAVFFSALEALHRRLSMPGTPVKSGVIVAIGYPLPPQSESLFNKARREYDLTPPTEGCGPKYGGAEEFADFIQDRVRPFVHNRLRQVRGTSPGKEAIFGHSFGGMFSLHLLFTRPGMFDTYIASSPSIWYGDKIVLEDEEVFKRDRATVVPRPSLMLFIGGAEENPLRRKNESEEEYEERRRRHQARRMVSNINDLYARLKDTGLLENTSIKEYPGEDHGTVIPCSLSSGLATFFEDWPFVN